MIAIAKQAMIQERYKSVTNKRINNFEHVFSCQGEQIV